MLAFMLAPLLCPVYTLTFPFCCRILLVCSETNRFISISHKTFLSTLWPKHTLLKSLNRRSTSDVSSLLMSCPVLMSSHHTVYKVKTNDDGALNLKIRIAPHGSENSCKHLIKSDCAQCLPTGNRFMRFIAAIRRWRSTRADVKAAFLQARYAKRDVYVRPPREFSDRPHYWLLLAAACRLINDIVQFQSQSDDLTLDVGLSHLPHVPKLFYLHKYGSLTLLVQKIFDDILISAGRSEVALFLSRYVDIKVLLRSYHKLNTFDC